MIADLESELALSLLERDRNGVALTSDGEMLLPCARDVVNGCRKLMMQADSLKGLRSGMIRIGTFSSTATHWLPNIIREFQKDYPAIDYELLLGDYEEIEKWVSEGRVDCGFTRLPAPADLEAVPLEEDPFMAIVPEGHPLASEKEFDAAWFEREPFLLLVYGRRRTRAQHSSLSDPAAHSLQDQGDTPEGASFKEHRPRHEEQKVALDCGGDISGLS